MTVHRVATLAAIACSVALGAATPLAHASSVAVLFACDFDESERGLTVSIVQSSDPALARGVQPGQRCVDAFAELLGRFGALRRARAEVDLRGPFFGALSEGSGSGAGLPGCDIWDFASNTVAPSSVVPPPEDALVAVLTCAAGSEGPVVLAAEANRHLFVRGIEVGTSCADAVAELSGRFDRLTAQRRTALKGIRPLVDRVQPVELSNVTSDRLRYYFLAAFK